MSIVTFPAQAPINAVVYNDTASVTLDADTSTEILAANPARRSLMLTNIGNQGAWIKCDGTAAVDKALYLAPNGAGSLTMDAGALTKGVINGRPAKTGKTALISIEEGE